jgi:hypothetical protein
MATTGTHDPRSIFVLLDGLRLEGFISDTIADYERLQEVQTDVGADGHVSITLPSTTAKIVTLAFYPSAPGYKILADIYKAERTEVPKPAHEYHQEDAVTGDVVSDPGAILLEGPLMSVGAQAGPRSFRILLPNPTEDYGANVTS